MPQAARQLKNHAFFRDINFEQMDKKGVKPPFVPVSFRILEHSINFKSLNQKPTSTKSSPACRQNSQSLTVATLTTWTRKCSRPLRASTRAPTKLSASSISVASVRVCTYIQLFLFSFSFLRSTLETDANTNQKIKHKKTRPYFNPLKKRVYFLIDTSTTTYTYINLLCLNNYLLLRLLCSAYQLSL